MKRKKNHDASEISYPAGTVSLHCMAVPGREFESECHLKSQSGLDEDAWRKFREPVGNCGVWSVSVWNWLNNKG
jgi:hypothetical protein